MDFPEIESDNSAIREYNDGGHNTSEVHRGDDDALQPQISDPTIACPTCGLAVSATQTTCPVDGTPLNQCLPGFILDGKYEFVELIGSGGMGVIYKARQIILNRPVAVKMLHSHLISDKAMMRFQREGKAGSALSHQNITSVLDFAMSEHGQPYMVLDFEAGKTLSQMIDEQVSLDEDFVVDAIIQVCHGLAHAHERNVLHRDLKPSNLMVVPNGSEPLLKILDFGIAKIMDSSESRSITRTGETMGSPPYMSPEQSVGSNVDRRSDLYSLGCVMFESLTGTPPFMAENVFNILMAHANVEAPSLKEATLGKTFPSELERIVKKLLAKKPEDRYQTAQQLEADLQRFKAGGAAPLDDTAKTKNSRVKLTAILSMAISLIALLAVGSFYVIPKLIKSNQPAISNTPINSSNISSTTHSADSGHSGQNTEASSNSPIGSSDSLKSAQPDPLEGGKGYLERQLSNNDGAEYLELGSQEIKDADMQALARATNCQRLDLQKNSICGPGLKNIGGMTKLGFLRLDHNDIHDDSLRPLLNLTKLKAVNLGFNEHFTGKDLSVFGKNHRLIDLNLENTGLTDDGLKALKNIDCALAINLANTKVSSRGMAALASIKENRAVVLSGTRVDRNGLAILCKKNPWILTLYVDGLQIGDESVPDILKLQELDGIDVSGTNITSKGILQLLSLKKLNKIWCGSCDSESALVWIRSHRPDISIDIQPRLKEAKNYAVPDNLGRQLQDSGQNH